MRKANYTYKFAGLLFAVLFILQSTLFVFPVLAEETPADNSGSTTVVTSAQSSGTTDTQQNQAVVTQQTTQEAVPQATAAEATADSAANNVQAVEAQAVTSTNNSEYLVTNTSDSAINLTMSYYNISASTPVTFYKDYTNNSFRQETVTYNNIQHWTLQSVDAVVDNITYPLRQNAAAIEANKNINLATETLLVEPLKSNSIVQLNFNYVPQSADEKTSATFFDYSVTPSGGVLNGINSYKNYPIDVQRDSSKKNPDYRQFYDYYGFGKFNETNYQKYLQKNNDSVLGVSNESNWLAKVYNVTSSLYSGSTATVNANRWSNFDNYDIDNVGSKFKDDKIITPGIIKGIDNQLLPSEKINYGNNNGGALYAPDLFSLNDQSSEGTAKVYGKQTITDYKLGFTRNGDTYTLNNVYKSDGTTSALPNATTYQNDGSNFFPLNDAKYKDTDTANKTANNCYFGMRYDVKFKIGDYTGPLNYSFKGDDDLWVILDGKVIVDVGGIHGAMEGNADVWKALGLNDPNKLNDNDEGVNEVTVRDTTHTLTVLYMERGAWASNCKMNFTLPNATIVQQSTIDPTSITVHKIDAQSSSSLAGATFKLENETGKTTIATTDAYGSASFAGLYEGTYTLTETSAPLGYLKNGSSSYTIQVSTNGNQSYINKDGTTLPLDSNGISTISNTKEDTPKGKLTITKTIDDPYTTGNLVGSSSTINSKINSNQTFIFKVDQYEVIYDAAGKPSKGAFVRSFNVPISFDSADTKTTKTETLTNLQPGYYTVTEEDGWSKKYKAVSVLDNYLVNGEKAEEFTNIETKNGIFTLNKNEGSSLPIAVVNPSSTVKDAGVTKYSVYGLDKDTYTNYKEAATAVAAAGGSSANVTFTNNKNNWNFNSDVASAVNVFTGPSSTPVTPEPDPKPSSSVTICDVTNGLFGANQYSVFANEWSAKSDNEGSFYVGKINDGKNIVNTDNVYSSFNGYYGSAYSVTVQSDVAVSGETYLTLFKRTGATIDKYDPNSKNTIKLSAGETTGVFENLNIKDTYWLYVTDKDGKIDKSFTDYSQFKTIYNSANDFKTNNKFNYANPQMVALVNNTSYIGSLGDNIPDSISPFRGNNSTNAVIQFGKDITIVQDNNRKWVAQQGVKSLLLGDGSSIGDYVQGNVEEPIPLADTFNKLNDLSTKLGSSSTSSYKPEYLKIVNLKYGDFEDSSRTYPTNCNIDNGASNDSKYKTLTFDNDKQFVVLNVVIPNTMAGNNQTISLAQLTVDGQQLVDASSGKYASRILWNFVYADGTPFKGTIEPNSTGGCFLAPSATVNNHTTLGQIIANKVVSDGEIHFVPFGFCYGGKTE